MNVGKKLFIYLLSLFALLLSSCSSDDNNDYSEQENPIANKSLFEIITEREEFSSFEAALRKTDLLNLLNEKNKEYTLLIPSNKEFDRFLSDIDTNLELIDKDALKRIMQLHILRKKVVKISNNYKKYPVTTISDVQMNMDLLSNMIVAPNGENTVIRIANILSASNGIVYSVGSIIQPRSIYLTIDEIFKNSDDLSLFNKALKNTDLLATLKEGTSFTIFAPTDKAFGKMLRELNITIEDTDNTRLTNILKLHIIGEEVLKMADLSKASTNPIRSLGGELFFKTEDDNITVVGPLNKANIASGAYKKSPNFIIYKIDNVLLPPLVLNEILALDEDLSMISEALKKSNVSRYIETLLSDNYTFFAPNNAAMRQMYDELGTDLESMGKDKLDEIILPHFVDLEYGVNNFSDDLELINLFESTFIINVNPNTITDPLGNKALIIDSNLGEHEGSIHKIDKVLKFS